MSATTRSMMAARSPARCRSGGSTMRQAAKRRRRSRRNRPSRTSVSRSRVVEATSRNGSTTAGCRGASRTSPSRRIRARRRWADAGSSSMSSRNSVPAPAVTIAASGADRFEIACERAPGDGPEQPAVHVRRSGGAAIDGDERRPCARAGVQRFRDRLRTATGFGEHQHGVRRPAASSSAWRADAAASETPSSGSGTVAAAAPSRESGTVTDDLRNWGLS